MGPEQTRRHLRSACPLRLRSCACSHQCAPTFSTVVRDTTHTTDSGISELCLFILVPSSQLVSSLSLTPRQLRSRLLNQILSAQIPQQPTKSQLPSRRRLAPANSSSAPSTSQGSTPVSDSTASFVTSVEGSTGPSLPSAGATDSNFEIQSSIMTHPSTKTAPRSTSNGMDGCPNG